MHERRRDIWATQAPGVRQENRLIWPNSYLSESFGNIWNVEGGSRDHPVAQTQIKAFQKQQGAKKGQLLLNSTTSQDWAVAGQPSCHLVQLCSHLTWIPKCHKASKPWKSKLSQCVMFESDRKHSSGLQRLAISTLLGKKAPQAQLSMPAL